MDLIKLCSSAFWLGRRGYGFTKFDHHNFFPTNFNREMTITAWYMDSSEEDQRCPHKLEGAEEIKLTDLDKYGVLSWSGLEGACK